MELHMIYMIYVALPIRTQTEKTTFSCKDDYTLKKHTWRWTYSALQYLFYLYSVSLGDALSTAAVRPFFNNFPHFKHPVPMTHCSCVTHYLSCNLIIPLLLKPAVFTFI